MAKKTLIIDDDPVFLTLIDQVLTSRGYEVLKAGSGQEGLRLLFTEKADLVLLDVVMPRMDGWQTCQRIREISDVPVIMLTDTRKAEEDIVRGLDYGADDYLFKPVRSEELLARMRALLRRAELSHSLEVKREVSYTDDFLTVDIAERRVTMKGERVKLTSTEFRLLALLVENAGRILTHKQILEKVWGWEYADDSDYVRVYISYLRRKIEPDSALPRYIITEPGVGYSFQPTTS